jgi:molybdopterin synthase catalytic subunit
VSVEVLYFAVLRDLVGLDREELEVPNGSTIRGLARDLEHRHPALAGRLRIVRFALDETFVTEDTALHDGAVVALIPPVAGG